MNKDINAPWELLYNIVTSENSTIALIESKMMMIPQLCLNRFTDYEL